MNQAGYMSAVLACQLDTLGCSSRDMILLQDLTMISFSFEDSLEGMSSRRVRQARLDWMPFYPLVARVRYYRHTYPGPVSQLHKVAMDGRLSCSNHHLFPLVNMSLSKPRPPARPPIINKKWGEFNPPCSRCVKGEWECYPHEGSKFVGSCWQCAISHTACTGEWIGTP
jgi:hypothetical protein